MRRHFTYANVVATLALVLAVGGGSAYAASKLITGKQVKDGSLAVKDLSRKARTELRGRRGPIGPVGAQGNAGAVGAGAQGPAGQRGQAGGPGPRGVSAWEAVPSGTTLKGSERFNLSFVRNGGFTFTVQLGGRVPLLQNVDVNFAPDSSPATTEDDPRCSGTLAEPTAPPGQVCLYLSYAAPGLTDITGLTESPVDGQDVSFQVSFAQTRANADALIIYTWAYTAP